MCFVREVINPRKKGKSNEQNYATWGGYRRNRLRVGVTLAAAAAIALIAGGQPGEARAADGTTDVTVQIAEGDENLAWSVPTQIPMKATAGGTLIGPDADAIAIRNLSALPIRVKQMDTTAEAPFNLVDNVDKSNGNNDFQMAMNGVVAKQTVELADDGTWAMGYAGNGDGSDVLPLTVSAAKIARVTADLSTAKKAATITWTVEPTEHAVKQDPQPDPENGGAFAVYSEDDKSLDLYKRDSKPEVGDTFNGKAVTKIIDIDETDASGRKASPFQEVDSVASKVEVVDGGIRPISTLCWFAKFESLASINVIKLDVSNDSYMKEMFWTCSKLTSLDFSGWDTSNVTDMSGMFSYCYSADMNLSSWNTSNVTDMGAMFYYNPGITSIGDVSGWDTSNVTDMNAMFYYCSELTGDCSDWNVSNVTEHNYFNEETPGVTEPKWAA